LKKVGKYQVNATKAPVLGNSYDMEDRKYEEVNLEDEVKPEETVADILEKDVTCFEDKQTESGFILPAHPLRQ